MTAERASGHTLIPVGVGYCIRHHGILNEDDHRCDFAADGEPGDDGEPMPCATRPLVYIGSDCESCDGTGWLVTSSIDEGFPCPMCNASETAS